MKERINLWKIMFITTLMLAIICIILALSYPSNPRCFMIDSRCLDLTGADELPLDVCSNGYTCNDYCQKTYGTTVKWVSKCITNGSEECINVQACVCETKQF